MAAGASGSGVTTGAPGWAGKGMKGHGHHTSSRQWLGLVSESDEVNSELLDVNKSLFEEMDRHSKAMSAIYLGTARHSETSSSDLNSGSLTPDELRRGSGCLPEYPTDQSQIWDGDPDNISSSAKEGFTRTTGGGTPIEDMADYRVDELLEQERTEKAIFVKASLQLLLERQQQQMALAEATAKVQALATTQQLATSCRMEDGVLQPVPGVSSRLPPQAIIKSGFLKKANHHAMGTMWKTKLVEIHPGLFVYEDDDNMLGRRKKSIPLMAGLCTCRGLTSRKNNVFELSLKKGAKRMWMCSSEEDREAWLKAMQDAMLAAPQGPNAADVIPLSDSPYASDMRRYKRMKECFELSLDRETYQKAVEELTRDGQLCVPFHWIRTQIGEFYPLEAPLSRGTGSGPGDMTQLWKDMSRDKVCINGQVIYGETGPEAILGGLARAVMALAAKAREVEVKAGLTLGGGAGGMYLAQTFSGSGLALSASSMYGVSTLGLHQPLGPLLSSMTEVQVVGHTMEILLACNRTQSGGNTYYCVEYLFRNPALVVLCPYSSHAEPLNIALELCDDPNPSPECDGNLSFLSDDDSSVYGPPTSPTPVSPFKERARKTQSVKLPRLVLDKAPTLVRSNSTGKLSDGLIPPSPVGVIIPEPEPLSPTSMSSVAQVKAMSPSMSRTQPLTASTFVESPPLVSPTSGGEPSVCTVAPAGDDSCVTEPPPSQRPVPRPAIRVKIQANTQYKICPLDPQDDNEDIWSIVSARFEQQFVITGSGLVKGDELIELTTMPRPAAKANRPPSVREVSSTASMQCGASSPHMTLSPREQQQPQQQSPAPGLPL